MDELIQAVRSLKDSNLQDEEAFRVIYEKTNRVAMAVIRRYCDRRADHEDILQETYERVYRSINQLQDETKIQAWINKIAANTAIRQNMKKQPEMFSDLADEDGNVPDFPDEAETVNPDMVIDRKAVAQIVQEIIAELPEDQRTALWMVYGQQITIKEMAHQLGLSENTIKSRLYQGRNKLLARKEEFLKRGIEVTAIPVAMLVTIAYEDTVYAATMAGAVGAAASAASVGSSGASAAEGAAAVSGTASAGGTAAASAAKTAAGAVGAKLTAIFGASAGVKAAAAVATVALVAGGGLAIKANASSYMDPIKTEIEGYNDRCYGMKSVMEVYYPTHVKEDVEKVLENSTSLSGNTFRTMWEGQQTYPEKFFYIDNANFNRRFGEDWKITCREKTAKRIGEAELEKIAAQYERNPMSVCPKTYLSAIYSGKQEKKQIEQYFDSISVTDGYKVILDMKIEGNQGSSATEMAACVVKYGDEWVLYAQNPTDLVYGLSFPFTDNDDDMKEDKTVAEETEELIEETERESETSKEQESADAVILPETDPRYDNETNRAAIAAYHDAILNDSRLQPTAEQNYDNTFIVMDVDDDGVFEAALILEGDRFQVSLHLLTYDDGLKIESLDHQHGETELAVIPKENRILIPQYYHFYVSGIIYDFTKSGLTKADSYGYIHERDYLDKSESEQKALLDPLNRWLSKAQFCRRVLLTKGNVKKYLTDIGSSTGTVELKKYDDWMGLEHGYAERKGAESDSISTCEICPVSMIRTVEQSEETIASPGDEANFSGKYINPAGRITVEQQGTVFRIIGMLPVKIKRDGTVQYEQQTVNLDREFVELLGKTTIVTVSMPENSEYEYRVRISDDFLSISVWSLEPPYEFYALEQVFVKQGSENERESKQPQEPIQFEQEMQELERKKNLIDRNLDEYQLERRASNDKIYRNQDGKTIKSVIEVEEDCSETRYFLDTENKECHYQLEYPAGKSWSVWNIADGRIIRYTDPDGNTTDYPEGISTLEFVNQHQRELYYLNGLSATWGWYFYQ